MHLPIYKEITLKDIDAASLDKRLSEEPIGNAPLYLDLSGKKSHEVGELLLNLRLLFKKLGKDPKFPYPFYIIAQNDHGPSSFPIVESISQLPEFYFCHHKHVSGKESKLAQKLDIHTGKINNLDMRKINMTIKSLATKQKELFLLAKENDFLAEIIERLDNK